jgi:hypothetical protein
LFQEPIPTIPPSGLQQLQPSQQIFGMGSGAFIRFKFGDEPALLRNLLLPIGDLFLGFG